MPTVQERLNNLELAQETIGFAIATCAEAIHREQKKANPDEKKITRYDEEMKKMEDEMEDLRLNNDAGVQNAIEKYTQFLKKTATNRDDI